MDQARQLARLLRGLRAKINLIPFNRHPRLPYEPPPAARTLKFQEILREANYTVLIRESRGQEINAACGQLAGEKSGLAKRLSGDRPKYHLLKASVERGPIPPGTDQGPGQAGIFWGPRSEAVLTAGFSPPGHWVRLQGRLPAGTPIASGRSTA